MSSAARGVATLVAVTRATVGAERWCGRRRRGTGTLRFTTAAIDTCMGGRVNLDRWPHARARGARRFQRALTQSDLIDDVMMMSAGAGATYA